MLIIKSVIFIEKYLLHLHGQARASSCSNWQCVVPHILAWALSEGCFIFDFINTFEGRTAHLTYHAHKSGRNTSVIIISITWVETLTGQSVDGGSSFTSAPYQGNISERRGTLF